MALWKTKLKAFGLHLLFSMVLVSTSIGIIRFCWYPDILFSLENVWQALRIMVLVDTTLGPLMTLYLWDPNKKGVKFDIVVVVILQVSALAYGMHTIHQERPAVFAFAGDRFEIIADSKFDPYRLKPGYFGLPLPEPLLVYALPAQDREEQNAFVLGNVQYQKMPDRYRPLSQHKDAWQSRALHWSFIQPAPADAGTWVAFRQHYQPGDAFLFPLEGTTGSARMVVIGPDGALLGYLDLDPWEVYKVPEPQPSS